MRSSFRLETFYSVFLLYFLQRKTLKKENSKVVGGGREGFLSGRNARFRLLDLPRVARKIFPRVAEKGVFIEGGCRLQSAVLP